MTVSFLRGTLSALLAVLLLGTSPVLAQQPVPIQQTTPARAIIPQSTIPVEHMLAVPTRPAREPDPPADQLANALNEHDLVKVTALLQGDPTLAKTLSSIGAPPLVSALRYYYGYDATSKQILQKLIDSGADVNAADRSGTTPLQALLTHGNSGSTETLSLLLSKGADFKTKNADGKSALFLAVASGDIASVNLLLSRGADVNVRAASGDTPLHQAVTGQNPDMIDALLNAGANVNLRNDRGEMPIHLAMRLTALQSPGAVPSRFSPMFGQGGVRQDKTRGNPLLVPQLLDRGAQINARDQSGMTPLLFALLNRDKINYAVLMQRHAGMDILTTVLNAAATNDTATLARLLKTLPDVKDLRAPTGATALHVAALWNAPDAVRLLLHSGGLETSARDAAQETPLHYACWFPQNAAMVGLLLDAGANINAEDVFGETPLHLAFHSHSPEIIRLLLAKKALPNQANNSGETPLSLAVSQGDAETAAVLITAGANVNAHSRYGGSLLTNAIQSRSTPMVTLLLAKGADVNYVIEERGESPLMQAVQSDNKEIVQLLLDKGADPNYKTRWGQSILSMARNYNNSGIADLLKQHGAK